MKHVCLVLKCILIIVIVFFEACQNDTRVITEGEYTVKGNIKITSNDTLFEGPIEYYNKKGQIVSSSNFHYNYLNGLYRTYYDNGKVELESNYYYDKEHGESKVYDSTGKIIFKNNYYYGRELGSTYNYQNDSVYYYRFLSFDGWELYSCRYNKDSAAAIIENGSLLNYITNYKDVGGVTKIELFIYLVNPPHKKITYKIFDIDLDKADTSLVSKITVYDSADQFKILYLDVPKPQHKYYFKGDAFYPKENVTIENILEEKERDLRLPRARYSNN